jgi:FkbM family methyltransferase
MLSKLMPPEWKEWARLRAGAITLLGRLRNLHAAGFKPSSVVDAGAFRGDWTREALKVFPDAAFLLIEPQDNCRPMLQALARQFSNVRLRHHLLGRTDGEVRLLVEGSNSRVLNDGTQPPVGAKVETHQIETLRQAAEEEGFDGFDFLKLDLQGHELEALAGAGPLFGSVEVIMTEVSWLKIGEVPLVHEVIAAFVARGYRPYDIIGHNYRRLDRALWQTDVIFVREDSPLLASRAWA